MIKILNTILFIVAMGMLFRISHLGGERLGKYLQDTYGPKRSIMDD